MDEQSYLSATDILNVDEFFNVQAEEKLPSMNHIKADICEDFICERISTNNIAKRYGVSEEVVLNIIAEVFPDEPKEPFIRVFLSDV
jgi:hypothetical protein